MRSKVLSQTFILHIIRRKNVRKLLNFEGRGLKFFMDAHFYVVVKLCLATWGLGAIFPGPNFFWGVGGTPPPEKF